MAGSIYRYANYEGMSKEDLLASIEQLHSFIDMLQKHECELDLLYFTHLPPDIKAKFLDNN